MYFLLKMGIFQPAMLVYQRVPTFFEGILGWVYLGGYQAARCELSLVSE